MGASMAEVSTTIVIPAPIAQVGDEVLCLNRCRPPKWEVGVVFDQAYYSRWPGMWRWSYTVRLKRRSRSGRHIDLHAPEAGLMALPQEGGRR